MPNIQQLSQSVINKIAAGEVIERPASVVKELVENSVDAGASRIDVSVEQGGAQLVRVTDNGCGISTDQLLLAVASHATSKIETADDLFSVESLGFRGEALASISEVSEFTLRSRMEAGDAGAEMEVTGGRRGEIAPCGCPVGTTIEVRNLFYNTPVRRKFLRTTQTEMGHVTEAFTRIALSHPHIHFTLRHNDRVIHELAPVERWSERIVSLFGDEIGRNLIWVEGGDENIRVFGYAADPQINRSHTRMQYLFLNGRHIRDRSLQHALGEAYRGLLMVGRFPVCFLRLEIPADMVDVNVHPTKMEVRFQESGKLYSQLLKTLRHEFLTTDLTARARHVPGPVPAGLRPENPSKTAIVQPPQINRDEQRWNAHSDAVTQVGSRSTHSASLGLTTSPPPFRPFDNSGFNRITGSGSGATERSEESALRSDYAPNASPELPPGAQPWRPSGNDETDDTGGILRVDLPHVRQITDSEDADNETAEITGTLDQQPGAPDQASHLGYQVHNRYLITQDEEGMVVVDQHALHERILYEQLRVKTESKSLESQRLLVPEPLDLTPSEAAAAVEHQEVLESIGINIEPFGGDTILMTSYPAMLSKMRPIEVLRQVLEPLMSGGKQPDARELLDELLHLIACKAAIKAGDKLSGEEITALLEQRYLFQDTHHCPHGRPTALHFSREQLDKMFKRT